MASTSNFTLNGENATNTAHSGSFAASGQDVQFTTNTTSAKTITMTFDDEVANVMFSMFDLDNNQRLTFSAANSMSVAQTVALTKADASSGITILGQQATGPGTNYGNNDNYGTLNVSIAGPVKTIVISLSSSNGDIWLSDINACVTGSFPSNWRNVSRPFTGMPSYILTVINNRFLLLDPATGKAKELFTDPGHTFMNGMGYDPVNRILYYTYSLTSTPSGTRTIYKYDVDAETIGTFVNDIRDAPLYIPTYDPGVTSGSASFYNGSLYFGVEASNSSRTSGRENTVWKIDFDGLQNPTRATQVYASRVDSNISGTDRLIHDWSDIGVTNGILYDFDGAGAGTTNRDSMYSHIDLMTGQKTQYLPSGAGNIGPKQLAIDWQENVYNMGGLPTSNVTAGSIGGFIVPYNYNGTVNDAQNKLVYDLPGPVYPTGSWGDCSEAFRPTCDFGDAPASYDPDPWSPAVHERDTAIHIGAGWDREWNKTSSVLADADGSDEDGLPYVPIFSPGYGNYLVRVTLYNNTGENATVIAWLDYNGNGLFDAGEACQAQPALASMPVNQYRWLYWPYAPTTLSNGSFTYLRIRLVKSSAGMGNANPTGYYDHGETEDYRVPVDNYPLAVNLLSFDAQKAGSNKAKVIWSAIEDIHLSYYEIQRSGNARDWAHLTFVEASNTNEVKNYELVDANPLTGINYYRLVYKGSNNQTKYSEVKSVRFDELSELVSISPNPANTQFDLHLYSNDYNGTVQIRIAGTDGRILYKDNKTAVRGNNTYSIKVPPHTPSGIYIVEVVCGESKTNKKLIIRR